MKFQQNHNHICRKKYSLTVILIFLCMYITTCGISDIPLYDSASIIEIAPGVIKVSHNANSDQTFIGYHVYYKLYDSADITTISADKSYITDTTKYPSITTITGKGYRELVTVKFTGTTFIATEKTLKPQIKTSPKTYYFDFSAGTQVYNGKSTLTSTNFIYGINENKSYQALLIEEDTGTTTILHRMLNEGQFKPFFDTQTQPSYSSSDPDVASMIGTTFSPGDKINIVLAVIPYGVDFITVQKIYGDIVLSSETNLDYTIVP